MKFENINEIILSLLLWITSNTDYGNITVNPKVQFLVQSELAELACNRPCEIIAYTPKDSKEKIYLSKNINPTEDVCDRGVLLHELIHIYQNNEDAYADYDEKTRKHMMEMEALVLQNRYLSTFGKKILYSRGFAGKFKNRGKNDLYC
tara:strand:+ start:460 stop:903 length:444 start_codon:yes stop_codon:yes gene_type:complete